MVFLIYMERLSNEMFCRGRGYWTGTNSSVGKVEAARRSGALSGMTMSGEYVDSKEEGQRRREKMGFQKPNKKKENDVNSSLITVSIIENLVSEINEQLCKLSYKTPEQYESMRAVGKVVNNLQREELFNLRKVFE